MRPICKLPALIRRTSFTSELPSIIQESVPVIKKVDSMPQFAHLTWKNIPAKHEIFQKYNQQVFEYLKTGYTKKDRVTRSGEHITEYFSEGKLVDKTKAVVYFWFDSDPLQMLLNRFYFRTSCHRFCSNGIAGLGNLNYIYSPFCSMVFASNTDPRIADSAPVEDGTYKLNIKNQVAKIRKFVATTNIWLMAGPKNKMYMLSSTIYDSSPEKPIHAAMAEFLLDICKKEKIGFLGTSSLLTDAVTSKFPYNIDNPDGVKYNNISTPIFDFFVKEKSGEVLKIIPKMSGDGVSYKTNKNNLFAIYGNSIYLMLNSNRTWDDKYTIIDRSLGSTPNIYIEKKDIFTGHNTNLSSLILINNKYFDRETVQEIASGLHSHVLKDKNYNFNNRLYKAYKQDMLDYYFDVFLNKQ